VQRGAPEELLLRVHVHAGEKERADGAGGRRRMRKGQRDAGREETHVMSPSRAAAWSTSVDMLRGAK
jgi:hypothetical protein